MFRFRLQPLLRLRQSERDQRRAELAKALRALAVLKSELSKLEADRQKAAEQGRSLKSPGNADIDALLGMHRYQLLLAAQEKQLRTQLAQVEAECERRRLALVEADREVKVLEKLRDKREADFERAERWRESKQLDEAGVAGFLQRRETTA